MEPAGRTEPLFDTSRIWNTSVPAPLASAAERFLGLRDLTALHRSLDRPIAESLLQRLEVTCRVSPEDLRRVPRSGPAVVLSNHPTGILEGAVLATVLREIRPDVRILANDLLQRIPGLNDLIIGVDPIGRDAHHNREGMRRALDHLANGGLLVIFPAGEVAHFDWRTRTSADPAWSPSVARLLSIADRREIQVTIVPVHVSGSNSPLFHAAGMIHARLRTALLGRELLNKKRATVDLRIGTPVAPEKLRGMPSARERIEYLRWRSDLLENRSSFKARTALPLRRKSSNAQKAIVPPVHADVLSAQVAALGPDCLLCESGDLGVYLAPSWRMPQVLREIGRLREITFRAAGEGTGESLDLDRFDQTYQHLFVWNAKRREIAGAYRLGVADEGPESLYTHTLFRFGQPFLDKLGPAVELGRSFIRAEYQKSFSPLLLLWKGIGKFIARNPQYRTLFGPVSISNQYQAVSRELMMSFLEQRFSLSAWRALVEPRHAPLRTGFTPPLGDVDELSDVVSDIEAGTGIPVLLRQYLRLGGKLLAFNVDPDFSHALDGLIVVDLMQTDTKLLERYLGREESSTFLQFHKGSISREHHGTH